MRRRRVLLGLAMTALAVAACGPAENPAAISSTALTASVAPPAPTIAAPPMTMAEDPQKWVDLQVGDCIAEVPAVDLGAVTVSIGDCAAPHAAEVYLRAPVEVDAAITDVADRACAAGVDQYTGGAGDGALSVTYLIDSKQDRTGAIPLPSTVICLVQAANGGPLTGSVRG